MTIRIINRYLFRRFLFNLFFCTVSILAIYVVLDYVGKIKKFAGIPLSTVGLYYVVSMPGIVNTVFSIIMLLTAMFTMGSLARHNEITAMRSAGMSIFSITRPIIYFAFSLVLFNIVANETVLPSVNHFREEMYQRVIKKRPVDYQVRDSDFFYSGRNNVVFHFKGVYDAGKKAGENVEVDFYDRGRLTHRLFCARLRWEKTGWQAEEGILRAFLPDSLVNRPFRKMTRFPRKIEDRPEDVLKKDLSPDEMNFFQLDRYIDNMRRTGRDLLKINARRADLHFRISLPFISFIIALFGVSLTVKVGRAGNARVFGIGLFAGFFYYFLVHLGLGFGRSGALHPVLGAWMGNIIFFPLSVGYFYKVSKLE